MTDLQGNATEEISNSITELYALRANYIINKDISGQKSMHTNTFECIATDGKRYPEQRWEQDIQLENKANDYKFSVFEIEKIDVDDLSTIVYVTRRCAGVNNRGKSFNTEIRLRDEWSFQGADLKLNVSETISRRVWLNGIEMTISEIRPKHAILLQGCGDYEK